MDNELLSPSAFSEAADMDTASERLVELAHYAVLQPLVAANPATPATVLEQLSEASDPAVRRAVAQNPNASVQVLGRLAGEFPQEFLHNPIIPILNMTRPGFIKELPFLAWASLLRFENLSLAWLQQIKTDRAYQRNQAEVWKLVQLHATQTGETREGWRTEAGSELKGYRQQFPRPVALDATDEVDLFLLFALLFPHTVPMLKDQWVNIGRIFPDRTTAILSLSRATGSKTMTALSAEKNSLVRCQVARHPCTSVKVLGRLAAHSRPEIRRAAASNPRTPLESVYALLSDPEPAVRRVAVSHASLTREDHEIMALDEDSLVRAALATLPRLERVLLAQLASDPVAVVRAAVARNLKAPLEILATLARDAEPMVRTAAAGNPRLPVEAQSALLSDPEAAVRASLSGNACLSGHASAHLAQDPALIVRKHLAANPRTPVTLLEQLWQTGEMEVWQGLAHHPHTSPELLVQLAERGDVRVRSAVAAHKHAPVDVLHMLAQQNSLEIWYGLLANPHTPLAILEQALAAPHTELWSRIISHPVMARHQRRPVLALLADKLQQLIVTNRLPNWLRRAVFQYHSALPTTILESFSSSPYWEERYLVARHPHMSEAMLNTLAHDGICYVRAAAHDTLEQRQRR